MPGRRGFTLIELLVLAGGLGGGAAVVGVLSTQPGVQPAAPAASSQPPSGTDDPDDAIPAASRLAEGKANSSLLASLAKARSSARQLKCATQVRGIDQAMIVWASSNQSKYPLPSEIDVQNQTVAEVGRAKDTTGNIYSVLIYNGSISCEICVCPDEHEKQIKAYAKYEYTNPAKAVTPNMALWDPAFRADFTKGKGRTSYAHLEPSGDFVSSAVGDPNGKISKSPTGRLTMWSDTFMTNEAIVADRGPGVESVSFDDPEKAASAKVKTNSDKSITLRNHGDPTSWEGNVGFNDAHVELFTTLGPTGSPSSRKYTNKEGANRWDVIFFDEPDDAKGANTFLGIFVKAGKTPKEFAPIWD